jgi:hypothetical protein
MVDTHRMDMPTERSNRDGNFRPIVVRRPAGALITGALFLAFGLGFLVMAMGIVSEPPRLIPRVFGTPIAIGLVAGGLLTLIPQVKVGDTGVSIRNFRTRTLDLEDVKRFVEIPVHRPPSGGRNPTKVVAHTSSGEIEVFALHLEYATGDRTAAEGRQIIADLNSRLRELKRR